jgi:hypothetical protein
VRAYDLILIISITRYPPIQIGTGFNIFITGSGDSIHIPYFIAAGAVIPPQYIHMIIAIEISNTGSSPLDPGQ